MPVLRHAQARACTCLGYGGGPLLPSPPHIVTHPPAYPPTHSKQNSSTERLKQFIVMEPMVVKPRVPVSWAGRRLAKKREGRLPALRGSPEGEASLKGHLRRACAAGLRAASVQKGTHQAPSHRRQEWGLLPCCPRPSAASGPSAADRPRALRMLCTQGGKAALRLAGSAVGPAEVVKSVLDTTRTGGKAWQGSCGEVWAAHEQGEQRMCLACPTL